MSSHDQLSRDEAIEKLDEYEQKQMILESRIDSLTDTVHALHEAVVGDDANVSEYDEKPIADRLDGHDEILDALEDITQEKTTKEQKVAAIVRFADQKRDDDNDVMRVFPQEIRGLLGVTRRYSYDLVDAIAENHEWARVRDGRTQASAKDGGGRRRIKKALELDFAGVHGDPVPVNKFTTNVATAEA